MMYELDEALERIFDHVGHALCVAAEAHNTSDEEDEEGNTINPIHRYSDHLIKRAAPLAVMGLFVLAFQSKPKDEDDAR